MSVLFMNVLRQALKTFDRKNQAAFTSNLNLLQQMTGELSVDDILYEQREVLTEAHFARHDAPCTFVNIFENDVMSMSVFVLRGNFKMPLHDHPKMYGILRCIFGNLCIQSYSSFPKPDVGAGVVSADLNIATNSSPRHLTVCLEKPTFVKPDTACIVLTPHERNFHEITAVNGVAAFFDILSPPYNKHRHCNFYRCLSMHSTRSTSKSVQRVLADASKKSQQELVMLEKIAAPNTYYCETAPTPKLVLLNIAAGIAQQQ